MHGETVHTLSTLLAVVCTKNLDFQTLAKTYFLTVHHHCCIPYCTFTAALRARVPQNIGVSVSNLQDVGKLCFNVLLMSCQPVC